MQAVLETVIKVAEEHGAERILKVNLEVGELTFLNPEQLRFAFKILSERTMAEGARLRIRRIRPRIKCSRCEYEGPSRYEGPEVHVANLPVFLKCPKCGGEDVSVSAGRECNVKDIRVKVRGGEKPLGKDG